MQKQKSMLLNQMRNRSSLFDRKSGRTSNTSADGPLRFSVTYTSSLHHVTPLSAFWSKNVFINVVIFQIIKARPTTSHQIIIVISTIWSPAKENGEEGKMGDKKKREEEEVWQTPGSGPVWYYPPSSSAFQIVARWQSHIQNGGPGTPRRRSINQLCSLEARE